MIDLTNKTIEELFYSQIKKLTLQSREESFDYQFSDLWSMEV